VTRLGVNGPALGHVAHRRTVRPVSPLITIGPDAEPTSSPNSGGLQLSAYLHFQNATLPTTDRLEVDLGYATDGFSYAGVTDFWTHPSTSTSDGASTGVQLDSCGRGERHAGERLIEIVERCY